VGTALHAGVRQAMTVPSGKLREYKCENISL
jgi:hypothetical protein